MKQTKYFSLLIALFAFLNINGQALFINDNAVVTIESTAVLYVDGDLQNTNSGVITNNGTIELVGDLENSATISSGTGSVLRLSGNQSSDITSGSASFANLEANKDAGSLISLNDDLTISEGVDFTTSDNRILCNGNSLIMLAGADFVSPSPSNYVVTDLVNSKVTRKNLADGDQFHFPVGANNTTFNPVDVTAGTGHTTDDINVHCNEQVLADGTSGSPLSADVVDVSWEIDEATSGDANVNVTLHWKDGVGTGDELTGFDASNCGVSRHDGVHWDLTYDQLVSSSASLYSGYSKSSRDEVTDFSAFAVGWQSVAKIGAFPKVFLESAYDGGTNNMTPTLNGLKLLPGQDVTLSSDGLISFFGTSTPAGQPYNVAPWNHTGTEGTLIGDPSVNPNYTPYSLDIVDWVLVSIREGDNLASSQIWQCAGLLKEDGTVVFPQECSFLDLVPSEQYYVVVEHRNHMPIMSNVINENNNQLTADFTISDSWIYLGFFGNGQKLMSSGSYVMYGGNDSNTPKTTNENFINSTDEDSWRIEQNAFGLYLWQDMDMNGYVNSSDQDFWRSNQNIFTQIPW